MLVMVALAALTLGEPSPPNPGPKPGAEALAVGDYHPPFLLKTLNPERSGMAVFSTKAHVGSQASEPKHALLIDFAASYCAPCKEELPRLQALVDRYRARGVQLAVVVIDEEEEGMGSMRKLLLDEMGLAQPVVWDRFNIVARRYGASTLPFLVLIDGAGKVSWLRAGYEPDTVPALEAALEKLATPAAPDPEKKAPKPR